MYDTTATEKFNLSEMKTCHVGVGDHGLHLDLIGSGH